MLNDINIIGGTVITPEKSVKADIGIKEGKIVNISTNGDLHHGRRILDVSGSIVMPGMIDAHVHMRAPSFSHREDFASGTAAAAAGGITTIVEMPVSKPPTSDVDTLKSRINHALNNAYIDFCFYAGAGSSNIEEIPKLAECGVVGFKTFLMPPPPGREKEFYGLCTLDEKSLKELFGIIGKENLLLAIHAEDQEIIKTETELIQKSGRKDLEAFGFSRPPISEIRAVKKIIKNLGKANTKILICHVSTPEVIDNIQCAKQYGLKVYSETCPHYLLLNVEEAKKYGGFARVKPPIRQEALRQQLWQKYEKGLIDIVSSDHAPYTIVEKNVKEGDIWKALDGIPGLELTLPLLLNKVNSGEITYNHIAGTFSENPAKILGIYPKKGSLDIGSDADLTIVNPNLKSQIKLDKLYTKSRESAAVYENWELSHTIIYTLCRGQIVFDNGKIVGKPGYGEYITPLT
ncbi:MAG: allantoinase AllB [Tepidanaerobacteraceae bacterium]